MLARYLADQMPVAESLQSHRKAFCLGNILPDIRPSFLTKKHEFFGTFEEIQDKIKVLVENEPGECKERVYWRQFGEVIHYMADYFTFPHNKTYTGTLIEHGQYEKALKKNLKTCIKSGEAHCHVKSAMCFENLSQLTEFIKTSHASYLRKKRNVAEDINYILNVCFQVIQGIFQLCTRVQLAAVA
ncbi:MAG: zinc dependent phospholipase C family protein [Eubacteriales bacterium]|nr:zinc dependent phospholipase C family protein [Eubacteriales bacterium]